MKRKITLKQYNDLDEERFKKLEMWTKEKGYGPLPYHEQEKWKGTFLSIGQLLEFLEDHKVLMLIQGSLSEWHGGGYKVTYVIEDPEELTLSAIKDTTKKIEGNSICDLLWKIVLEVLEHEK